MASLISLLPALLLLHFAAAAPEPRSSKSRIKPFVVGGEDASKKQFPEIVSLQVNGNFHICGGTLIDKNWILTAAHCVENVKPEDVSILAGTRDHFDRGTRVQASSFEIHQDYATKEGGALVHDVALIKTADPMPLSKKVRLGSLQTSAPKEGDAVTVAGWGKASNSDSSPSRMLQHADLEVVSYDDCQEAFSGVTEITDDQVCTFASDSDQGSCMGDSGGPLFSNGQVLGVVSWSITPCGTHPGVYASVPEHYDWIKEKSGLSDL